MSYLPLTVFKTKKSRTIPSHNEVTALAGKHDLNVAHEQGSSAHDLWKIIFHPDWDSTHPRYDADLVLCVLDDEVTPSFHIYPVCLPEANEDDYEGRGVAVGWGMSDKSPAGVYSDAKPKEIRLEVPSQQECFMQVPDMVFISSNRTFCAGFVNQSKAICPGDSGGGLYEYDQYLGLFSVKGIVSSGLNDVIVGCNPNSYTLFTNVGKFVKWIRQKVQDTHWKGINFDFETLSVCWTSDRNRDDCIRNNIQSFLPTLQSKPNHIDFPSLEPLKYDHLSLIFNHFGIYGTINVRDLETFGLTHSEVQSVRSNFNKNGMTLTVNLKNKKINIRGQYTSQLTAFAIPYNARGDFSETLTDTVIIMNFKGILKRRGGEKYMNIIKCDMTVSPNNMHFDISGLFPDLTLNQMANDWLNQNWRTSAGALIADSKKEWEKIVMDVTNRLLSQIPFRRLMIQDRA